MKLLILDRDGVINYDSVEYIKSPEEWIPIPGSLAAIKQLTDAGYTLSIATNQSGVGHKLYDLQTLHNIHDKMKQAVAEVGGTIDSIFFCPHIDEDRCDCRKPKPGMLKQIAAHYQIDLQGTFFIGDTLRDIQAGHAVGCRPILLLSGYGKKVSQADIEAFRIPVFADLAEATVHILGGKL